MNILILHALGDFSQARTTSLNHIKCYEKYLPNHAYVYQDVFAPVTKALLRMRFHAVILDTGFLCMRYCRPRSVYEEVRTKYQFVKDTAGVRVAQPQDEYDHSEILDEWLTAYGVDIIHSVCWDSRDHFYSRVKQQGAVILPSLTGYIDDDAASSAQNVKPFEQRRIDVGYRARRLPPEFGRYGQLKTQLGERFLSAAEGRGLKLDISMRPEDVFLGNAWQEFLNDSKYTLGMEGGSSILDKRGEIRDRCLAFAQTHPNATFEEAEAACFPGEDKYLFSAISPRSFEVAAAGSAQIMLPGSYLGVLKPNEHYIEVQPDFANAAEVFERMKDVGGAKRMIAACREALLDRPDYRYSTFARKVIGEIEVLAAQRKIKASPESELRELLQSHAAELTAHAAELKRKNRAWMTQLRSSIRGCLPNFVVNAVRSLRGTLKPQSRTPR